MFNGRIFSIVSLAVSFFLIIASSAAAKTFYVGGKEGNVFAYVSQGVGFNIAANEPDNEENCNSAIFTLLAEGVVYLNSELRFYASGKFSGDWIYEIKESDSSWQAKEFDKSDRLGYDDEYWQLLNELHVTWTPGKAIVRVGKQVISWGEMDGQRIMDQINPLDQRRGFADVEFESSIIPIWLLKGEYFMSIETEKIKDLGIELVFNPNVDFIPSQPTKFGNDAGGIWAMNLAGPMFSDIPGIGLFPTAAISSLPPFLQGIASGSPRYGSRFGKQHQKISDPDNWSPEGFEYGGRLKALVGSTLVTINGFYGRENLPVERSEPGAIPIPRFMGDGTVVMETSTEGFHPYLRILGATMSRDIEGLQLSMLGGVAPVLRVEAVYGFDSTYTIMKPFGPGMFQEDFETFDNFKWGVGMDWKIKCDLLNSRNYFMVSPQFFHHHVFDYPGNGALLREAGGAGIEEDNYSGSLMISTQYLHQKLIPSVFILRDFTNEADFVRAQVAYNYNDSMSFMIGSIWLGGSETGKSFELFDNKDQLFVKFTYKFN